MSFAPEIQETNLSPEIKAYLTAIEQEGVNTYLFELLYDCPAQGDGIHQWLYRVAYQLVLYFKNDCDEEDIIYEYVSGALPGERANREIPMAVKSARRDRFQSPEERLAGSSPTPKAKVRFSYVDEQVRKEAKGQFAKWPHWTQVKGNGLKAEPVIDTVYSWSPLLCAGIYCGTVITRPREFFRGAEEYKQFIVPNPMTALTGTTKNGKAGSARNP